MVYELATVENYFLELCRNAEKKFDPYKFKIDAI